MNSTTLMAKLREVQQTVGHLLTQLKSSDADKSGTSIKPESNIEWSANDQTR